MAGRGAAGNRANIAFLNPPTDGLTPRAGPKMLSGWRRCAGEAAVKTALVAYDEQLVDRVRARIASIDGLEELSMIGGWGVTVCGNMAVGVMNRDLIVRVGPEAFDDALAKQGVRPFDFTGRPMTGWVFVAADTVANGRSLNAWIARGVEYAQSLPAKTPKKRSQRKTITTRSRKGR